MTNATRISGQTAAGPDYVRLMIERVLPAALAEHPRGDSLRLWVVGGTASEIFGLACATLEALEGCPRAVRARIFATGIDEAIYEHARGGFVDYDTLGCLPEALREKYFVRVMDGFRVSERVREILLFSRHRLLYDPPFSRLDVVSFVHGIGGIEAGEQDAAFARFEYALRPGRFLVTAVPVEPAGFGFTSRMAGLSLLTRKSGSEVDLDFWDDPTTRYWLLDKARRADGPPRLPISLRRRVEASLLRDYAAGCAIVDEKMGVVYLSAGLDRFLDHGPQNNRRNMARMARAGLAMSLQLILRQCERTRERQRVEGVPFLAKEGAASAHLEVVPFVAVDGARFFRVTFELARPRLRADESVAPAAPIPQGSVLEEIVVLSADRRFRETAVEGAKRASLAAREISRLGEVVAEGRPGLILVDLDDIDSDVGAAVAAIARVRPGCPVVVASSYGMVDRTVEAIHGGATEFLPKPLDVVEVLKLLERVKGSMARVAATLPRSERDGLVGRDPAMIEVYKAVAHAAACEAPVLIRGEPGTGRETVARAIHAKSTRTHREFLALDCGGLAETQLESAIFGHLADAFSGAGARRVGLLEAARGGTLFLGGVAELPRGLQAELARVIGSGEFRAVGSREMTQTDVRIVGGIAPGESLLPELNFRLGVLGVTLPALRERSADLAELAMQYLTRACARAGKPVPALSEEAVAALAAYDWPGNLRELENAMEYAVAMSRQSVLGPPDFPESVRGVAESPAVDTLATIERQRILETLERAGFNKSLAAQMLGISRVTLYRKVRRLGLE